MLRWIRRHKKILILGLDFLVAVGCIFCEWLSNQMLATPRDCQWLRFGLRCMTCGGTHFVNSLLNGKIFEAFQHNEYLFILTAFLLISLLVLNVYVLFDLPFCKKLLKWMYSIPTVVIFAEGAVLFLVVRNLPFIIALCRLIASKL